MDWTVIFCLLLLNTLSSHGNVEEDLINQLINYRRYREKPQPIVGTSMHPDIYNKAGDNMRFLGETGLRLSPGKFKLSEMRYGYTKLPKEEEKKRSRRLNYQVHGKRAMQPVSTFLQKLLSKTQEQLAHISSPSRRWKTRRHLDLGQPKSYSKRQGRRLSKQRDPPGHRLLQPTGSMLKSAAKYPHQGKEFRLVYGNLKNLGGVPGRKDPRRIVYSDFRKNVLKNKPAKKNPLSKRKKSYNKENIKRVHPKKFALPKRNKKNLSGQSLPKLSKSQTKLLHEIGNITNHSQKSSHPEIQVQKSKFKSDQIYGNTENLGIVPSRKEPLRVLYSDFRKKLLRIQGKKDARPKHSKKKSSHPEIQKKKSRDKTRHIYGSADNLGLKYAKEPFRLKYSDFRRFGNKDNRKDEIKKKLRNAYENGIPFPGWRRQEADNDPRYEKEPYHVKFTNFRSSLSSTKTILDQILDKFKRIHKRKGSQQSGMIILHGHSSPVKGQYYDNELAENDNDASEVLDDVDALEDYNDKIQDFRKRKVKSAFRNRTESMKNLRKNCSSSDDSSSSSESTQEKNPGNPYTIHKNKYKTNWIWNLAMTGDHMNINPYGPQFANQGPSGAQLFFGRKWWYFNQDDYRPFR